MAEGDGRRLALVRAAFDSIAEHGFEGLRLRAVAVAAGIDHSTLHHYFPTKEHLVADVVEYATRQFWPTMPDEGGGRERLRAHLAGLGRMMRDRPDLFAVLAELDLRAGRDPAIRSIMVHIEEGWRAVLAEVLHAADLPGTTDPAVVIDLIIAAVKGGRLAPDQADRALRHLADLLTGHAGTDPTGDG
jgi:TetR/AcrR family transcriptional repressor of nem operon